MLCHSLAQTLLALQSHHATRPREHHIWDDLESRSTFSQSARLLPRRAKLSARKCLSKKEVVRVFCVFGAPLMQYFCFLFLASRRLRPTHANVHRKQESSARCYMSPGGKPYSSSSNIANSSSSMTPSASFHFFSRERWCCCHVRVRTAVCARPIKLEMAPARRETLAAKTCGLT